MKKNIFMIMMLSLVFLGLGNVSFAAETIAECTATCTNNGGDYETCHNNCLNQAAQFSPPSVNTENEVVDDTNQNQEKVKCNVGTLNGDLHAYISIPGASCTCEKGYGEYYNTSGPKIGNTTCELCTRDDVCCGTKLNTKIPFIGDCIESSTQSSGSVITETTAFPVLVTALVKILISVILVASFILIIAAGVMIATGNAKGGKDMIVKVAIGLAILGASGVILRLINPNFFG